MRELVILVADATIEEVFKGFFGREDWHEKLGCAMFSFNPSGADADIIRYPGATDGAVHLRAHDLLRTYTRTHRRALVVLDQNFGAQLPALQVRKDIMGRIAPTGWTKGSYEVVVIDPDLEVWMWQDSPSVERALGQNRGLRKRLEESGAWPAGSPKPTDPKGTFREIAKKPVHVKKACRDIAREVGLARCRDAAFSHFRDTIRQWFPR